MHRNQDLYQFLLKRTKDLTENWYENLDKNDPTGIYASTNPAVITRVKDQNNEFHKHFIEIFTKEQNVFTVEFNQWIHGVASDQQHLETPLHYIIREFMRTRSQYLELIDVFRQEFPDKVAEGQIKRWRTIIIETIDEVIIKFTEETHKYANYQLQAQQEMINELSSPVISISDKIALLPLVGDIDTKRAKIVIENTLSQCAERRVEHLCIDLSGVVIIDTMVAQQLFQLINALKLIGVKTTLSGIRPEIASTAVKLGLSMENIDTKATLAQALELNFIKN
ncbi:STAS domain-containing protein [Mesobacillus maritimus]|uniref:STAS domain-containing protein n=1 Tax=Mesobacillus maritimus TaxID=1643336 RepID=UPI00203E4EFD|nr:STAS domain-containing protein [Mesobacillus maritimus]MCM3586210.1 STAS domain-containing protein [Mesobacillus maritimus]MCM3667537.1 STAS domain-containing protein [Mesobacillus maritimus]